MYDDSNRFEHEVMSEKFEPDFYQQISYFEDAKQSCLEFIKNKNEIYDAMLKMDEEIIKYRKMIRLRKHKQKKFYNDVRNQDREFKL